ncbi:MAG: hypothetical protein DRQ44_16905 [Gammaproteobacteria bacterium]|nr:MAG: hypothetical protein DRQ44_16905 [Gammaproteobacteria bacterium]
MEMTIDKFSFAFDRVFKYCSAVIISLAFCVPAISATATATATAKITSNMTVRTVTSMFFGELSSSAEAGTLALSPAGVRTTTGGVTVNSTVAGTPAAFDVQGDPNATYSVSFPAAVIMTNGSPNTMVIEKFISSPEATGVLDTSGQQTLFVGGTLNVDSNQAFGTYTGDLTITVDYN